MGEEVISLNEMVKRKICEYTRIRDAYKKQYFFEGKTAYINTSEVMRIKAPHPHSCKDLVPYQKKNGGNKNSRPKIFPVLIKGRLGIKAGSEGKDKSEDIERKVKIVIQGY
jgi:hypothetical protein